MIKEEKKSELKDLSRKGDSYAEIVERLLKLSEEELEPIKEVYRRIDETDREDYVDLEEV